MLSLSQVHAQCAARTSLRPHGIVLAWRVCGSSTFGSPPSRWTYPTSAAHGSFSLMRLNGVTGSMSSTITCSNTCRREKRSAIKSSSSTRSYGMSQQRLETRPVRLTDVMMMTCQRRWQTSLSLNRNCRSSALTITSTRWVQPAMRSATSTRKASLSGCARSSPQCSCVRRQETRYSSTQSFPRASLRAPLSTAGARTSSCECSLEYAPYHSLENTHHFQN